MLTCRGLWAGLCCELEQVVTVSPPFCRRAPARHTLWRGEIFEGEGEAVVEQERRGRWGCFYFIIIILILILFYFFILFDFLIF